MLVEQHLVDEVQQHSAAQEGKYGIVENEMRSSSKAGVCHGRTTF
jgi:hypothetical protein